MEGGGVKQAPIADGGQFLPCCIGRPFRACLTLPTPPRVPNFNEGSLHTVKLRRSPPARHEKIAFRRSAMHPPLSSIHFLRLFPTSPPLSARSAIVFSRIP